LIDAVEGAIGEDGDHIAGFEPWHDSVYDRIDVGAEFGFGSHCVEGTDYVFRVQTLGVWDALLLIDAGQDDAVGEAQALYEFGFQYLAAKSIRTRFQHCP